MRPTLLWLWELKVSKGESQDNVPMTMKKSQGLFRWRQGAVLFLPIICLAFSANG
jgi:hypothetical protein